MKRKAYYLDNENTNVDIRCDKPAVLWYFVIGFVLYKGVPNITWKLLTTKPSYLTKNIGILPDILNTFYIVIATLVVVLPLGVGAAIYLTEYATNKKLVAVIEYAAETLSGIPSNYIRSCWNVVFLRIFSRCRHQYIGGCDDACYYESPDNYENNTGSLKNSSAKVTGEGAFGLGAGKWRVIRTVVLPSCVDGIMTGCILAIGRILGDSAALLFTAGFAHTINGFVDGLGRAGATLTVATLCLC